MSEVNANGKPSMAAKKRKKKRKATAAQLRALAKGRKALKAKRAGKRKAPKARKAPKKRKAGKSKVSPKRRAQLLKLLAKARRVRKAKSRAASAHLRKHGPPIKAPKAGTGERNRFTLGPAKHPRFPIRNPLAWWKLWITYTRGSVKSIVGCGTRKDAERDARSVLRTTGARQVELVGPFASEAKAKQAA